MKDEKPGRQPIFFAYNWRQLNDEGNEMNQRWIEPVTLTGSKVILEPLSLEDLLGRTLDLLLSLTWIKLESSSTSRLTPLFQYTTGVPRRWSSGA